MKLTGIVIAKNEEEMIEDCLESLQFCDEIVVVDNESEDKTSEISKKYGARVIKVKSDDFSKLRSEGLKNLSSDWVLYLDADERVTLELGKEIKQIIINPGEFKAFRIKRKNYYFGNKEWPKIEKLERLFRKKNLKGWYGKIHESPQVEGEIGELQNYILHYTHRDLGQMLDKTNEWSEVEAELRFKSDHPKMSWWRFPRVMISAFFDSYYKQKGYKAGIAGLIESIYQSFSIFITYAKLWEKQLNEKT
ncbi:MAG: glycosyltransferase family 2 protein [Patescibacteria group bacterium]